MTSKHKPAKMDRCSSALTWDVYRRSNPSVSELNNCVANEVGDLLPANICGKHFLNAVSKSTVRRIV